MRSLLRHPWRLDKIDPAYNVAAVSPDGRALAIVIAGSLDNEGQSHDPRLFVVDTAGGQSRAQVGNYEAPAWSPDGTRIAATSTMVGHALACPAFIKRVRNPGHYFSRAMAEYRRSLPHFHPDGEYLFVRWRLHGSLPVAPPDIIYATPGHAFAAQDRALAQSRGTLWLNDSRVARQLAETIRDGERQKRLYESQAWVIMPKHVHLLILPQVALPQITHWIKGRTAREANRLLGRVGEPFWQQ